jgi:hypothetical protein
LAALTESVAGVPFETFVQQNLLQPVGLSETGFWGESIRTGAPIAPTRRKINTTPNWGFRGGTGMFSTTSDLYHWTRALLDYRILSKASTSQMLRAYVTTSRGGYGYGWFTSKTQKGVDDVWTAGYEDFGHNGIINAYATGEISVVLTNSGDISGNPARDLASQLVESVLQGGSNCNSNSAEQVSASVKTAISSGAPGNVQPPTTGLVPLDIDALALQNVNAEVVQYRGQRAVHLSPGGDAGGARGHLMAILKGSNFKDGTIEISVAGAPAMAAPPEARGFVGIAFRVAPNATDFEYVYLRPTNGRADDQLLRNHSTQYASFPGYPADRLRKENPGMYESYVDLESGRWTKFKLVVRGNRAALYIQGSEQPCLIVNDLKRGDTQGAIGLWIGLWTDGYFSNLRVTPQ